MTGSVDCSGLPSQRAFKPDLGQRIPTEYSVDIHQRQRISLPAAGMGRASRILAVAADPRHGTADSQHEIITTIFQGSNSLTAKNPKITASAPPTTYSACRGSCLGGP